MEAIVVAGVSKQFRRYHPERPTTFVEAFVRGFRRLRPAERFWALRDVSFEVDTGEMVGVIGKNGAGKSTLLRLIGGLGQPDDGSIFTRGRIGALLDLGAGFHPDLTGRENVIVSGVISGLTRQQVLQRFDAIVDFAELENFIDSPLRTYSTGMQMRLAFAVAAHIEPEVLLIDEVLAVGDINFQTKCIERIAQFKEKGCTVLLVSHETNLVEKLCDRVIWLRDGRMAAHGSPEVVVGQYVAEMQAETRRRTPAKHPTRQVSGGVELAVNENRFGSLEMEIESVHLQGPDEEPSAKIEAGNSLSVIIAYNAPRPIPAPIFSVSISRQDGFLCYDTNTAAAGYSLPTLHGRGQLSLHVERLDLTGGRYYVDVGVHERNWNYAYDYHWHVYPLIVDAPDGNSGLLRPPHRWQIDDVSLASTALPSTEDRYP